MGIWLSDVLICLLHISRTGSFFHNRRIAKSFLGRIKYAFYIEVCTLLMSPAATTPTYLIVGLMIAVTFTLLWNEALMRFTDKE